MYFVTPNYVVKLYVHVHIIYKKKCLDYLVVLLFSLTHSGRYDHNNETLILQNFAFIIQFYTYSNPYDMN